MECLNSNISKITKVYPRKKGQIADKNLVVYFIYSTKDDKNEKCTVFQRSNRVKTLISFKT